MKKLLTATLGLGLAAFAFAAPSQAADTKACFIYVGPIGDFGWTYQHDQGRLAVEKELGVKTEYLESVEEGADAERAIERYLRKA